MTYLNNLVFFIQLSAQRYPIYFLLVLFSFIEIFIIYKLFMYNKKNKDLKIYNLYLNIFFVSLYSIIFILLILIIRYIRFGYFFDLVVFYLNIHYLYVNTPLILLINICLILIILFLGLLKIKQFLNIEVLKLFIYYYHYLRVKSQVAFASKFPNKNMVETDYHFLVEFYRKLKYSWNYESYVNKLLYFMLNPLVKYVPLKFHIYCYRSRKYLEPFLKKLPTIMLIYLIIYDCIYNDYNIHIIKYYMPFYFIFYIWESITYFIINTNSIINGILYEMYYLEDYVRFLEITPEEQKTLDIYINRNCRCISNDIYEKDIYVQCEKREKVALWGLVFARNRRFLREENTDIFRNQYTNEAYELEKPCNNM